MGKFAAYDRDYQDAEDPNTAMQAGIFSVKIKTATAGTYPSTGKDYFKIEAKVTGPGHIGRTVSINYNMDDKGMVRLKSDLAILGAGHLKPSMLEEPKNLDCILLRDVEVQVAPTEDKKTPGKFYNNIYLRRLIDGPMPPDPIRFPPKPQAGGNGSNGSGDSADGQAGYGLEDDMPVEDPDQIPF